MDETKATTMKGRKNFAHSFQNSRGGKLFLIILYLPRVLVELGILQVSGNLVNEIFKGNEVATSGHLE